MDLIALLSVDLDEPVIDYLHAVGDQEVDILVVDLLATDDVLLPVGI